MSNQNNRFNQFGRVYSLVSQMFITIAVGVLVGFVLDLVFNTVVPWLTILFSFTFFALSLYNLNNQLKQNDGKKE